MRKPFVVVSQPFVEFAHNCIYSLLCFWFFFFRYRLCIIYLYQKVARCIPTCSNCFSELASSDNTRCIRHVSVLSLSSSLIVQCLRLFECRRRLASWFVRASVARETTEAFPFWTGLFWCLCTSQKKQNKNTFLHSYVMQDNTQIKSRQLLEKEKKWKELLSIAGSPIRIASKSPSPFGSPISSGFFKGHGAADQYLYTRSLFCKEKFEK